MGFSGFVCFQWVRVENAGECKECKGFNGFLQGANKTRILTHKLFVFNYLSEFLRGAPVVGSSQGGEL